MGIASILRITALFLPLAAASFDEVQAILRANCTSCHNASARTAGLSLESKSDILKGGKSGPAAVAGRPTESLLLSLASTGKMPPTPNKLRPAEIAAIRVWIERETAQPPVAERDVQAILGAKCWVCHGRREKSAGLDLRTLASLTKGGKNGPAIVPGNPDASLLVKRIAAQEMPPPKLQEQFSVRGLTDSEFEKVKRWIAEGAKPDLEQPAHVPVISSTFWSFQTPAAGPQKSIDEFIPPSSQASPLQLMRRAYFDLTGLPPTPEQVIAYEKDPNYEKLIDTLLASPRYGERWGRHWLDATGYADSEGGNNSDKGRQNAWRFRDYVIRSFNANKPFDRFLTEQIAGDELFDYRAEKINPADLELLAATGFWRMAPDGTNSTEQNFIPERMDVIAGQLEVFGSAVLGLSIGCARCHDHKYDPFPTRDYYRLAAMLTPAYDPFHWLPGEYPCGGVGAKCDENNTRFVVIKNIPEYGAIVAHNAPIQAGIKAMETDLEEKAKPWREKFAAETGRNGVRLEELAGRFEEFKKEKEAIEKRIRKEQESLKPPPLYRALYELGPEPPPARVLLRGDSATPGALVEAGIPAVLAQHTNPYIPATVSHSSGRRLGLAKWLTDPKHPLTARVMVNRIWQHHFGTGLVSTPGNFGKMGAAPANRELLDWLAVRFVQSGWDVKAMNKLIMMSGAYRQPRLRRIDAESVRDAILAIAGRLDDKQFGVPDPLKQQPDGEVITESRRRSVYVTQKRTQPLSLLETFDLPFMNPNCVQRGQSVVSSQSLHLLNSDLVHENARHMAARILEGDVDTAYLLALGRRPTGQEREDARATLARLTEAWAQQPEGRRRGAMETLCHALINSAEFLYLD
ncbi:MAG: DUF1553 domain-containing protein [Acidobacteria bacterium]|nr:DUF1553 domain-containing protein [Acidobacteriota bacterium]